MSYANFRILQRIADALERQAETGEALLDLQREQFEAQAKRMEQLQATSSALELNLMEQADDQESN